MPIPELIEPIVEQLIQLTEAGKVPWTIFRGATPTLPVPDFGTVFPDQPRPERDTFDLGMGSNHIFLSRYTDSEGDDVVQLFLFDETGAEIERAEAGSWQRSDPAWQRLDTLWNGARFKARDVRDKVQAIQETLGSLSSGSVPSRGFGLIVFGGGTIAELVIASGVGARGALYATVGGNFIVYVPGARIDAVNADFLAAFPGGVIPANTAFIGRR